jgi:uncharacterized membrane protein
MADNQPQQPNSNPAEPASQPQSTEPKVMQPAGENPAQQSADTAQKAAEQGVEATKAAAQQGVDAAKQAATQLTGGLQQGVSQLQNLDVKQMFKAASNQPKVTSEERMWAGISYIPLVALISLLSKPDSAYVKLHGRQGLLIFLVFFFCIFVYLIPFIGPLFGGLVQMTMFIAGLFSMYQAFIGNWWKIPVLGDIAEMIPIDMFTTVTTAAITGQPVPQQGASEQNAPTPEQQPQQPPVGDTDKPPASPAPPQS